MLVIIALTLIVQAITTVQAGFPLGDVLGLVLCAAGIVVAYRFPLVGLASVAASPLIAAGLGSQPIALWTIGCFAAFVLTLRGAPALLTGGVIAIANFFAVWEAAGTINVSTDPEASVAAFAALALAAAASSIRESRRYWRGMEQRTRDILETRNAAVDRSVAEERVRIARDLHDSIGHEIAVINMYLGSAEVHLRGDTDAALADIHAARTSVKAVLRETQQILHVLRVGKTSHTIDPTPAHGRIGDLVDSFRSAGLAIETSLPDLDRTLSPTVSAAMYRITQEALTNAERHGTGAVSLRIGIADNNAVSIEVVNMRRRDTEPPEFLGSGNGLVGMQERAASTGGSVEVRSDDRMFWVTALLPANGGEPE